MDGVAVIDLESPEALGEVLEAFKYLQNHWTQHDMEVKLFKNNTPDGIKPHQLASDYYKQFQSDPLTFFKSLDAAYRQKFLLCLKEALSIIREEKRKTEVA